MKKILLGVLCSFVLIFSVNAKGLNPKDYQFFNKEIGIALQFPGQWEIFVDEKKAPDNFKELLKNRTSKNNPAFLGMKKNQNAFTKLTVEKYDDSLEEYATLFEAMLQSSNIKVISETYSDDKNSLTVIYSSKVNNLPVQFIDYIVINNGYALRLCFWSLESMFAKQGNEFTEIAHQALFNVKPDKNNWVPLWANVKIANEPDVPATPNDNKYMFFTVKGKANTVYLMGSIHIGKSSFYPFPERIENAFVSTNNIVLEVNTSSKENMEKARDISSYGYLPDHKTLKDVLSADLYQALETNLANYNVPIEKMNRLKPWLIAASLSVLKMMSFGYAADSGTEKYFTDKAQDKKIFELESFEEQIKVMDSIDGNLFLSMTLLSLSSMEKEMDILIESWKNQDTKKMEKIMMAGNENTNQQDYFDKLFFNRNLAMTEKIKGYLGQNENYFVIVGSGHLVGDKGILALLKKAGYTVE